MRGMHRLMGLAGMAFCVAAVAPATASAATTLGATFPPLSCGADTYIQDSDPGNHYTVPSGGVITQWSYQSDSSPPPSVRFKVGEPAPGADLSMNANFTIVGQSDSQVPAASTLNTYSTQIPVKAGDRIGEFISADCSRPDPLYTDHFSDGDVQTGTTSPFDVEHFQQDISAVLEPDADHDGFGDETQDRCPTNGATQGPCPKKKCKHKKKHKSGAVIAKKCKKKHHH
jgi:hypothetical protein